MRHELKIWPQHYCRVKDGSKTFEVRKNDRRFQKGDIVILKEWDPTQIDRAHSGSGSSGPIGYTKSPWLKFTIGHVHFLDNENVVFSLLPYRELTTAQTEQGEKR